MKKFIRISLIVIVVLLTAAALFSCAHLVVIDKQIERETLDISTYIPELTSTTSLEILPLFENDSADIDLATGHGVSYLVRTDQTTVILDLGMNPPDTVLPYFLRNFTELKQDWEEVDAVVLSHNHPDHVGGIVPWKNDTFTLGDFRLPLEKITFYTPIPMSYPNASLIYALQPVQVGTDIATTGSIPFREVFPLWLTTPKNYEQALVVRVEDQGLVLVTGCGHPGLQTLVERAETLYREPVVGVVGGLHYDKASAADLQPEIDFLAARQPGLVALSPHDSMPDATQALADAFPQAYKEIKVGQPIQFPYIASISEKFE